MKATIMHGKLTAGKRDFPREKKTAALSGGKTPRGPPRCLGGVEKGGTKEFARDQGGGGGKERKLGKRPGYS